ncbi:MAG: insulinase family protein, partial [Cyclobacteriaceae bacterium]|nr:insulinase family protein [Cyclobacteriaceae bacterium]
FELRGAFVQLQSNLDFNTLSLYCLTDKLKEVFPFFLHLFDQPSFPKDKLESLKRKKEQELTINQQKSNFWVSKLFKEALFNNHPYGNILNQHDIKSITPEILNSHWHNNSLKAIKFITAAGNFDKHLLISEIESNLKTQTIELEKNTNNLIFTHTAQSITKTLDGNKQSSITVGGLTINQSNISYPSLSLGNTLFGGYFGSRLMQSIREEKGLTYGISSSIQHLQKVSFIQISADVKMGFAKNVVELIELELEKLISREISENELNKVKKYLLGEYKSNNETIFDKINKVKLLKLKGLNDSYFENYFNSIIRATSSDVQKVLNKYYNMISFTSIRIE